MGRTVSANFDPSVPLTLNGEPVTSGSGNPRRRRVSNQGFRTCSPLLPVRALPAVVPASSRETHVAPFIEAAAIESAATARRDDAKVFLREFTRELVREIKSEHQVLITWPSRSFLVGGMLYLGFAMYREDTAKPASDRRAGRPARADERSGFAN